MKINKNITSWSIEIALSKIFSVCISILILSQALSNWKVFWKFQIWPLVHSDAYSGMDGLCQIKWRSDFLQTYFLVQICKNDYNLLLFYVAKDPSIQNLVQTVCDFLFVYHMINFVMLSAIVHFSKWHIWYFQNTFDRTALWR